MRRDTAWRACIVGLIAITAAVGSAGCGRRAAIRNARAMDRYQQTLLRNAARDTGCHPSQLTPQQITTEPAVYTVLSCNAPVEYWLRCGRGNRCAWENVPNLNLSAAPVLACPPEMIQQQPAQAPNMRFAAGCGRMALFGVVCNGVACGWAQSGPTQAGGAPGIATAAPPPVTAAPPPVMAAPPPVMAAPPPGPGPSAFLQSQVQAQREAILSCIDSGSVVLRMRWTAQGQVVIDLPSELVGTAAEGCINAVVGSLRVAAQGSGEIVVPIR